MEKVKDKVREHPSMASSSNSEWPADETLSSKLNGGAQKQTVFGQGGIGLTEIINSNSNIEYRYENVQITENNYYQSTRRIDLDVCKDRRGTIIPTSKIFGESTARRNMLEIWDLIIGYVKKIGVYGMGGIGKTTVMKHINNRIVEGEDNKFDCVIWVTVSKKSSVFKLQHDISRKLGLDLSADKDPITRAGALFEELTKRGRYLLILDDLWEGYPLEDVGIPDPDHSISSNICKLVLTTRSLDVCRRMKCEAIKMDLLSKDEAWSLFLHHVGHEVLQVKDLEPIARGVALDCARLPLAIATIGRSMAGNKETCDWKDALAKLKAFSKEPGDEGSMKCEAFKMDLLSKDEAWSLFLHHVGRDELRGKDLEPIARGVALECTRLPLAITTIGRSMAGKKEICEWRYALAKLKDFSEEPGDEIKGVINQLKFSFDNLENKKIQKCLIYCALFPEDYEIDTKELVELLILDGIVEENESRFAEIDECNAILNKLTNQCLLETNWSFGHVKIHDLVRDMVLQINNFHSQYLTISDTETKKMSHVKWSENLLKIHILDCDFLNASPICPRLTTFILHNSNLPNILDSIFQHFEALKVLKLSSCDYLEVLPDSISNLANLVGLFLRECKRLRYVPTLAKLKKLQSLEILVAFLTHIPKDLEELSNQRYFNISLYETEVRELIITTSSSSSFAFQRLQTLHLSSLKNLEALIGGKKAWCNVFSCLRELTIFDCPRIKVIFNVGLLSNLKNLEMLGVTRCDKLEEIIEESLDNDKDLNETMTWVTLPKLSFLMLWDLSNLKSICPPTRRLMCESLKDIYITECSKLEQCVYVPFYDSEEPSPSPPSLVPIEVLIISSLTIYMRY